MISPGELQKIYEIISIQGQTKVDQATQQFLNLFNQDLQLIFKPCYSLLQMLTDNVLTLSQRLVSFFILIDAYKVENFKSNPFASNIIDILELSSENYEKKIFKLLITKPDRNVVAKITIAQYEDECEKQAQNQEDIESLKSLKKQILDSNSKILFGNSVVQIPNTVPDFNTSDTKQVIVPQVKIPESKLSEIDIKQYGPDQIRPVPQIVEVTPDDPIWINVGGLYDVQWEHNLFTENNILYFVKDIMQKAYQFQLSEEELKILNNAFEKDINLVFNCGLTPQLLQPLVDHNSSLASTILIKLNGSPQITSYFEVIISMELTLSSLEVVNKLVQAVQLPKEFINLYISQCIQQCEEQKKDKNSQNRLVRLVCVFIKSLIKNKIINPKDMFIELQAFCIEFSKITEANTLFKTLKSIDNTGNQNGQSQEDKNQLRDSNK